MPPAYQSILLVTGAFPALRGAVDRRRRARRELRRLPPAGALLWTSAVLGALLLWPAFERNSAISAAAGGDPRRRRAAVGVGLVFDASSATPYRWLLAAYAAFLVLSALALREPARRHAEVLIDAGGLAIAAIGLSGVELFGFGGGALPGIWEVVLLGAGFGLVAFGALDRSPGPAYLGVVNLAPVHRRGVPQQRRDAVLVAADPARDRCGDARSPACARAGRCRRSPLPTGRARPRWRPAPTRTRS